jgi:arsenite-transporting ATPase
MERARSPLLDLFEKGTYLDRQDVEPFLDLTLPGVDEVAGALRLAELAAGTESERIVVDTAPTGHTLRLLDAGSVIASWSEAFDAMAAKAAAVMGQLTRRPVRLAGDEVVEELQERVDLFRRRVLGEGAAVVVDREGSVVEAETRRLRVALEERGLRVGALVRVGARRPGDGGGDDPAGEPAVVHAPWRLDLRGCEGLERWGQEGEEPQPVAAAPRHDPAVDRLLADVPGLLLFVGKGGVGKSTCASAVALALARTRRVTLLGTDPAGSLADVLDIELPGGEAHPLPSLLVRQVDAPASFAELRSRYLVSVEEAFYALGLERSAGLDRRVVESLLGLAPPGLDEVFAVGEMLEDLGAGRTVVVDSAPSGHFLRLLAMPEVALKWTRQLLRVLARYRSVLGLDAFTERLLLFAKQLKDLHLKLRDPRLSGAFVITQEGPLVAAETQRLLERLRKAEVTILGSIWNRAVAGGPFPLAVESPAGAHLRAPLSAEPPVGAEALETFLSTWTLEP